MYFHGAELYHSYKCLKDYLLHANQQQLGECVGNNLFRRLICSGGKVFEDYLL